MIPPIVVGIDPRRHDPEAAVLAALLARTTGAPVVAVAVYPHEIPLRFGARGDLERDIRGQALARLSAVEAAFAGVHLETIAVAGGSAARVLHDCAVERGAGLLVVGSTHHGLTGRISLGSTADQLLHGAFCPVAVAPLGFAERLHGIDRVGVAFVDSDEGYLALRVAAELAGASGAEMNATTAVEPIAWSTTSLYQPYDVRAHLDDLCARARQRLECAVGNLAPRTVDTHVDVPINPAVVALEQLSNDVDLLVCGSRGWGPLGSVLLGGVSRRLIHRAACPVIVVPRGTERAVDALAAHEPMEAEHA